jgi:hypothetical protein
MLVAEVDGPCMLFGDNNSFVLNTKMRSLMVKKKHNAIACHRMRECVAANIVQFAHVNAASNLADCLTKPLRAVAFWRCMQPVLFRPAMWIDALKNEKMVSADKVRDG